jgi:hypothetical protein
MKKVLLSLLLLMITIPAYGQQCNSCRENLVDRTRRIQEENRRMEHEERLERIRQIQMMQNQPLYCLEYYGRIYCRRSFY